MNARTIAAAAVGRVRYFQTPQVKSLKGKWRLFHFAQQSVDTCSEDMPEIRNWSWPIAP